MRKIDEVTDLNSCFNKARPDEWLFVLLGRDPAAPYAVRAWAEERVRLGKNRADDPQIAEALAWADRADAERGNARRVELAEKKSRGPLGAEESAEFDALQAAFFGRLAAARPTPSIGLEQIAEIERRLGADDAKREDAP